MMKSLLVLLMVVPSISFSQDIRWAQDGKSYYKAEKGELIQYILPDNKPTIFASKADLTPAGGDPLPIDNFTFSADQQHLLIFTNSRKVWRLNTRGDFWLFDLKTRTLRKLGLSQPEATLMFAKLSPDGTKAAYVSQQNIYVEDLQTGISRPLTTDGSRKLINGTFDWVYEEEFACRDGFQWSPDSQHVAYWQIDANKIRDFFMINNTDSVYSRIVPVEYPTIGQPPSPAKIGVVDIETGATAWLRIPGDPQQHYLPKMEWHSADRIFVQQFNRKQNDTKIFTCNTATGEATLVHEEKDDAWIDIYSPWEDDYALDFRHQFKWLNNKKEFLWVSEKDGWRHLYRVNVDGKKETLITKGNFDVMDVRLIDEKHNAIFFLASLNNPTQKYLYKARLDGKGKIEMISPAALSGTHDYDISPNAKFAFHSFSNTHTKPLTEVVSLSPYRALVEKESIDANLATAQSDLFKTEFFKVRTEEGIEMDGWMVKPKNFDPTKKYPVLFLVYTEPWGANVHDQFGAGSNRMFLGNLAEEGYIYMTVDNRGTPVPKGAAWRKCVYRKLGLINIRDQALAAKEILKWPFVDPERIAVWGWSGGGTATLNLMFQYPDIYKTGIAIAAVGNLMTYDNIYEERYMGLPQENIQDIINGSPITYAKNLKGNLLYIHGTGDDNVHYNNAEMLINELIKYNKQFQFMAYPNRTHGIYEGEGTRLHLNTLYTNYLREFCPGGGR